MEQVEASVLAPEFPTRRCAERAAQVFLVFQESGDEEEVEEIEVRSCASTPMGSHCLRVCEPSDHVTWQRL